MRKNKHYLQSKTRFYYGHYFGIQQYRCKSCTKDGVMASAKSIVIVGATPNTKTQHKTWHKTQCKIWQNRWYKSCTKYGAKAVVIESVKVAQKDGTISSTKSSAKYSVTPIAKLGEKSSTIPIVKYGTIISANIAQNMVKKL